MKDLFGTLAILAGAIIEPMRETTAKPYGGIVAGKDIQEQAEKDALAKRLRKQEKRKAVNP